MLDLGQGILEEFSERAFPALRRRDGRFSSTARLQRPVADLATVSSDPALYEAQRKIASVIARRRIARRRVMWVPTEPPR